MINDALERILNDLRQHPRSSAREIARRTGFRNDRLVYQMLKNAAVSGACQASRTGADPWRWEVCAR
jgi:hypothetical protein